ncbi:hypothetical protein OIU83_06650 [Flavobacterium sp. LS1R49]|uniref:Uncharacterized protein n=1 Tax=Flavobacterium shii TaxID=2987687 RepID=A0A9X2ZCQ3_9FLAO|nr:hypothetical protein [Flavobacterium shii]MCV9927322.1 hypothetical protein [Flavobacterium shii]
MKIQDTDWGYMLKHWVFTLILGPIISQIIAFIPVFYPSQAIGLLEIFPIVFIASLIFSIPTYIIYAFVYNYLTNEISSIPYSKTILISIPVIGVFITTAFIDGTLWYFIAFSYSISSIITGLFFNLNFKNNTD